MSEINLKKIYSDKVRDSYEIDDKRMLMVAFDRLSAFDVILGDPIPGRGEILTQTSNFWSKELARITSNHFTGQTVYDVLPENEAKALEKCAVVARKLTPVKVKAIVRSYLVGSGRKDYQKTGSACGIQLSEGMQGAQQLPEVIFTPLTKAAVGDHDEDISFEECERIIGKELTAEVRAKATQLYMEAVEYAKSCGIIICSTKLEFGLDEKGTLTLMDEVLTSDSNRFWSADQYRVGTNPSPPDKQFARDWLEQNGWNKKAPAPKVPADVIQKTVEKYQEALTLLIQD